jgi:hypothetical protein
MKKYCITFVLLCILILSGCNGFGSENKAQMDIDFGRETSSKQEEAYDSASPQSPTPENESGKTPFPKKIIRNAEISLEVKEPTDVSSAIEKKVEELNGWIVESNTRGDDISVNVDLKVRIPASELIMFIEWVKDLGKVHYSRVYSDEITLEYYDTQARLENAKKQKEQYLEILKKATTIEEVLQVQSYIDSVQERIDSASRQMEVWNLQVEHSMVRVTLSQSPRTIQLKEDPTWDVMSSKEIGKRFRNSFIQFFSGLFNFIIEFLVQVLTIYLWIALIIWGVWVGIRKLLQLRRRNKSK